MRQRSWSMAWRALLPVVVLAAWAAGRACAQSTQPAIDEGADSIRKFSLAPEDTSVYAPPTAPREDEGVNAGGVNFDLSVNYTSAYIYRGVDYDKAVKQPDSANAQFEGLLEFNLGRLPHPFVGVFSNVFDSDPKSRFQEFRPFAGLELTLRPFTIATGVTSYIYPEREDFNTSEGWLKVTFDDSFLFGTDQPIFTPYVFGAYDYVLNDGFYVEAGVKHEFPIQDTPLKFTALADGAYVSHYRDQFVHVSPDRTGFQHYDVGVIATYNLNQLFKIPNRYGQFSITGYVYYTNGIENDRFHAANELWGGGGISFHY